MYFRFRWILVGVAFVGSMALLPLLVNSSHSAPKPISNTFRKPAMPNGADKAAWLAQVNAAAEARRQKYMRDAVDASRLEMTKWRGSLTVPGFQANESNLPRFKAICDLFANEPPAPEARKQQFGWLLAPESDPRCVGFQCRVEAVTETDRGTEVVLHVSPQVLSSRWPIVHCFQVCIETWNVSKDGTLTFVSAVPRGPNAPTGISTLMTD